MQSNRSSLALRAALAVILLIGFYVLAIGMAAGLLFVPFAEIQYSDHVTPRLDIFCVVAAGIILWSILPRRDRFAPPGPRIERRRHPALFRVLDQVAADTQQAMPVEVYAIPEINAWVAQRGGMMGMGSRRVMGLGLPLMQVLSVSEFRAIVAHEFGHYHGGDTALGPWIYRTRAAIERTLYAMSRHSGVITRPFLWYLKMYVRVTHAISRRQEFVADALAARVAGSGAMARALRAVHGVAPAFDGYWSTEMVPALVNGVRPPLADGFRVFLAAPPVARVVDQALERELASGKADPYDTHPPLRERLAALPAADVRAQDGDDLPAWTLLGDAAPELEEALIRAAVAGARNVPTTLRPIDWDGMLENVWAPGWERVMKENGHRLRGFTPADVPRYVGREEQLVVNMKFVAHTVHVGDADRARAAQVVGAALAIALRTSGLPAEAPLGEPIFFRAGDLVLRPFSIITDLANGTITAEQWMEVIRTQGIESVDLSTVTLATGPVVTPAA